MTGIKIREAQAADVAAIVKLNAEVHNIHLRLYPDIFKPMDPVALADRYRDGLEDETTMIMVAEVESEVVAHLIMRKNERPASLFAQERRCAYINEVCVAERCREQGIFRALLAEAIDVARKWRMSRLELDVWSENTAAKHAFSQCGFQTYNEKMKLVIGE